MHAALAEPELGNTAGLWWQHGRDLLASLDADSRVVHCNPGWTRLLGLDECALQGRVFVELLHPRDVTRAAAGLTWARARQPQQFVARCRHVHGHHVALAWSLSCTPGGLLLASGHEPTPGTDALPAAADAAAVRLQRVLAMGRLAGGIAHEFNNLLQALRNALELVRRQPFDVPGVQRLSENALRVLDQGARLTSQLLASSGAQRLQLGAVAVVPLLQDMRDLLQRCLPPPMRLQMQLRDDNGSVMADASQLENAVLNLVLNACDAMRDPVHGSVVQLCCERVLMSGDSELPTGEYLRLAVTDTGPGMSDAVRERALEPFFTTRPQEEGGHGRGLGLSQVHGFTRQCGGSTRIESCGPGGTTVCMLLPLLPLLPAAAPAGAGLPGAPEADPPCALVVADPHSRQRRTLCDSLRLLGYRAVPAADGPSALAAMQRHAAGVVLIDMAMPGRFGYDSHDLARRMRLAWPDVRVVLVDGEGKAAEATTPGAARAADPEPAVLQRPADLTALARALGEQGRQPASAPAASARPEVQANQTR